MAAQYVQTYTITVTGQLSTFTEFTDTVSFDLNIIVPCSDESFITVSGVAPSTQRYVVGAESSDNPMTFQHDAFTQSFENSAETSLCGEFTY